MSSPTSKAIDLRSEAGNPVTRAQAYALLDQADWRTLAAQAASLRERGWGTRISYSRKVFVPLTQLCRDVCHYCTFAQTPRHLEKPYLEPEDVLRIARDGAALGCKEVLFPLGDKPEMRYARERDALAQLGFATPLGYKNGKGTGRERGGKDR